MWQSIIAWVQSNILIIQTCIFIIQTCVFIVQTLAFFDQAKQLKKTVDATAEQSRDSRESIAQATKSATAMEKSADAAAANSKQIAILTDRHALQMRAYLSISINLGFYQDAKVMFGVQPSLVNVGFTPALNVRYAAKADIFPFPLPRDFIFPELETPRTNSGILVPHQTRTFSAFINRRLTDEEVADIKLGYKGQRVYIWGTVFYTDVFEQEHTQKFAHSIFWMPTEKGEIIDGHYADRHTEST